MVDSVLRLACDGSFAEWELRGGKGPMFSSTQEYALRAVIWLAQHETEGATGAARIAEETSVPASYLAKVLQSLAAGGILTSKRGAGGGFRLKTSPDNLTILQVVSAVEPLRRISTCPLRLASHTKRLCPAHARLDQALAMVEAALGKSTIREIMYEPGRPTPLVESSPQSVCDDENECGDS